MGHQNYVEKWGRIGTGFVALGFERPVLPRNPKCCVLDVLSFLFNIFYHGGSLYVVNSRFCADFLS